MPLYDDFLDARWIAPENSKIIQLSKTIGHVVGQTAVLLTRPAGVRILTVRGELGTIRIRPGRYLSGNDFPADRVFNVSDTINGFIHGFVTGEGPFQVTMAQAVMVPGTSVVIDAATNSFTRATGNWASDGFWKNGVFAVTNSSNNPGPFNIDPSLGISDVLVVDEDITVSEGAQTDLVITGTPTANANVALLTDYWIIVIDSNSISIATSKANALADIFLDVTNVDLQGLFNIGGPAGWAPADPPAVAVADGYGSFPLKAGEEVSFAAPEEITIVGADATAACSYWWGR